jgi:hypothetical protein
MIWHAANRQASAAKADRAAVRGLGREPMAGVKHAILPRGEGLRLSPFLKIGLGAV